MRQAGVAHTAPEALPPHVELHRSALRSREDEVVGVAVVGAQVLGQRVGGDEGERDRPAAGPGLRRPK